MGGLAARSRFKVFEVNPLDALSRVREFFNEQFEACSREHCGRILVRRQNAIGVFFTLQELRTLALDQKMMLAFHLGRASRPVRKSSGLGTV